MYDESGQPAAVKESGGASAILDGSGEVVEMSFDRDGKGKLKFERDDKHGLRRVTTTWGYEERYEYATDGKLEKSSFVVGEKKAQIDFRNGRPSRVRRFDGGEIRLAYHEYLLRSVLLREMTLPEGPQLTYEYDDQGRLVSVTCGPGVPLAIQLPDSDKGRLLGLESKCGSPTRRNRRWLDFL